MNIQNAKAQANTAVQNVSADVAQGQSILSTLGGAAVGDYSGLAAAAEGLVSFLPQGTVRKLADDLAGIGAAALKGAAIGAAVGTALDWIPIPGIGNAIGADVGAVVAGGIEAVKDILPAIEAEHFNPVTIMLDLTKDMVGVVTGVIGDITGLLGGSTPYPPQPDYRYLSEKMLFPKVANSDKAIPAATFTVNPGALNFNPRSAKTSLYYELPFDPNAKRYTFMVTWRKVPGSTAKSRNQAYQLTRFYLNAVNRWFGHINTEYVTATWADVIQAFDGNETAARRTLTKVIEWYGTPTAFNRQIPFSDNANNPGHSSAYPFSHYPAIATTLRQACARIFGIERPLDYLYYPIFSAWDNDSQILKPCALADASDVFLTPDTTLLSICEQAALGYSNRAAYHRAIQDAHLFATCRLKDSAVYPGIDTAVTPNLARIVALTFKAVRREDGAKRALRGNASARNMPVESHSLAVYLGVGILGASAIAGLMLLSRR